eukprot:COSAG01_NODE_1910_length_8928_cov_33.079964_7_plen_57_part_00
MAGISVGFCHPMYENFGDSQHLQISQNFPRISCVSVQNAEAPRTAMHAAAWRLPMG